MTYRSPPLVVQKIRSLRNRCSWSLSSGQIEPLSSYLTGWSQHILVNGLDLSPDGRLGNQVSLGKSKCDLACADAIGCGRLRSTRQGEPRRGQREQEESAAEASHRLSGLRRVAAEEQFRRASPPTPRAFPFRRRAPNPARARGALLPESASRSGTCGCRR